MVHRPGTSLHLLADLAATRHLADPQAIAAVLTAAAQAARAQLVGLYVHPFGEGQGVTGVAMLAESHISIHTWPETGQAAVDLFVCGEEADAEAGLAVLVEALGATVTWRQRVARLREASVQPL